MLNLLWPWMFALLPLPWLARRLLPPAASGSGAALRLPFYPELATVAGQHRRGQRMALLLAILAWLLLLTAAARPQWVGEPVLLPQKGRDLMLAVDISGSMETEDMVYKGRKYQRLEAVKAVASDFIERRVGDRVGLILFGRNAYLQAPLTFDHKTVITLLREAAIGLAGKETAIGDAIGLAVKRLQNLERDSRVLILMTDGANTAGAIDPLKAGELAAQEGVKIYTIGIGADRMVVPGLFGNRVINPSADLDEKTLRTLAESTGGRYFRARDVAEMEQIYQLLDQLEPREQEQQTYRPVEERFWWPLAGFMLVLAVLLGLRQWQNRSLA